MRRWPTLLIFVSTAITTQRTLMSIFLQTLDNFHVYIGDDASKEDLQSVILDFPQDKITYKRFKTNLGSCDLISQWKRCIALSSEEPWIWLFSDDDLMSPTIMRGRKMAETHPITCVLCPLHVS